MSLLTVGDISAIGHLFVDILCYFQVMHSHNINY